MAITVEELVTKWGLNFDGRTFQSVQDRVEKLKTALLAVSAGFAAASAAVIATAKFTSDAGTAIERVAGITGVTTEKVQELGYAFEALAGLNLDQYSDLFSSFARRIQEAITLGTGEAIDGIKTLGLTVESFKDSAGNLKDPIESFYRIADAIKQLPPAKQQLALDQLFEGESEAVVNVLKGGREEIIAMQMEAQELGLIMDREGIQKSIEFSRAVNRLKAVMTGLRNVIGTRLLPDLSQMINRTIAWVKTNKELVSSGLIAFGKETVMLMGLVGKGFSASADAMIWFVNAVGGVDKAMRLLNVTLAGFAAAGALYLAYVAFIPAAIAAGILALAFIIEDIWTLIEGGDSIIGDFISSIKRSFSEGIESVKEWYDSLSPFRRFFVDVFLEIATSIWEVISLIGKIPSGVMVAIDVFERLIEKARNLKEAFVEEFREIEAEILNFVRFAKDKLTFDSLVSFVDSGIDKLLGDDSTTTSQMLSGFSMADGSNSPFSYMTSISPEKSPVLRPQRSLIEKTQNNTFNFSPQLPNLPSNLPRQEAIRALERGASNSLDDFYQYVRNLSLDNEDEVDR